MTVPTPHQPPTLNNSSPAAVNTGHFHSPPATPLLTPSPEWNGYVQNSLFALHGRMGRLSMMAAWLGLITCFIAFNFITQFLYMVTSYIPHGDPRMAGAGMLLGYKGIAAISIIALLAYMQISVVRRLHDLNRSGWWIVAPIVLSIIVGLAIYASNSGARMVFGGIFVVNLCWFTYLFLAPGTKGDNRFGLARYTSSTEKNLGWISMVLFALIAVFLGTMILILGQVPKISIAASAMPTTTAG